MEQKCQTFWYTTENVQPFVWVVSVKLSVDLKIGGKLIKSSVTNKLNYVIWKKNGELSKKNQR